MSNALIVTVQEVKDAVNFPTIGGPVSDTAWERFIRDATEEVERIYKTRFGWVDDSGTADGDFSTTTFSDSTKSWTVDQYDNYVVWVYGGTGAGQYREIVSNTDTKITISPAFDTVLDDTSMYKITHLGYKDQIIDGTGTEEYFIEYQPLINLNELEIDNISITTTSLYIYNNSGKIVLSKDSEVKYFSDSTPQLIKIKYIYGLYPLPRQLKRLITILTAMRGVASKVSGSYIDFATISLPGGVSGNRGIPYINLQAGIRELEKEAIDIREGYRPFVVLG